MILALKIIATLPLLYLAGISILVTMAAPMLSDSPHSSRSPAYSVLIVGGILAFASLGAIAFMWL